MYHSSVAFANNNKLKIFFLFLSIFLFELIRTAFITDDAGITLRTVMNFIHGFGPTFNVAERVQAYTHPLWFLLISFAAFLTNDIFFTTFFLSITLSLISIWLFAIKIAKDAVGMSLGLLAIVLSKSYLDFSTSGLENPLSHCLILICLISAVRVTENNSTSFLNLFFLSVAGLYLTRQDLILLLLPVIALVVIKCLNVPKRLFPAILIGVIPVFLWTFFALYYYGFPFPNTAYAKLATGLAKLSLVEQGVRYFIECFIIDPLTLSIITLGMLAGVFSGLLGKCLSAGICFYLVYILNIGGDFMAGRFFTAPFLLALVAISRLKFNGTAGLSALAFITALGIWNINHTILSGANYVRERYPVHGVDDVRGFYYQDQGLLTAFLTRDKSSFLSEWTLSKPSTEVTCGNMGFQGLHTGPGTHLVDLCALSDPLLARLPTIRGPWQSGHFYRALPTGYLESVAANLNLIANPEVKAFYTSIRLITRGSLNDIARLKELVKVNFRGVPKLDPTLFRYPINLDEQIFFKADSKGASFLKDGYSSGVPNNGWASAEPWGVWAVGSVARLSLPVPIDDKPSRLALVLQVLSSSTIGEQQIEVYVVEGGGHTAEGPTARYAGGTAKHIQTVRVPSLSPLSLHHKTISIPIEPSKSLSAKQYINLEFRLPTPLQPKDLAGGDPGDSRELAMGLISAVFH